ncbi:hypothetical protein FA13DRAFT_1816422 [Coprinellus micaceus]|uniref:Uncharacterized protein n=1 Tax=Coprinellus micaceus TaxID=71717 RepID=A0A4Y7T043_COPMI|nr:hypothetical protein FA13DRAFT_1816422 [Coprinellus micaceus]
MLPPVSTTMENDGPTATYRICYLLAFLLETALYGVYFFLFLMATVAIARRKNLNRFSTRFQFAGVITMFILISLHNFGNTYRMLQAFVFVPLSDPRPGVPALYLRDWQNWDALMFGIIGALLTWIGDVLVIYRCYLVWAEDYRVVVLPCLILITCISNTSFDLWWYRNPTSIPYSTVTHTLSATWPLNLSQNLITTGLIAYRIYSQHRQKERAGLRATFSSGTVSLVVILRIILESAAIYTAVMLMITVFWFTGSPVFITLTHIFVPCTGIVFALMSVRTYIAQAEVESMETTPSWIRNSSSSWMPPSTPTPGARRATLGPLNTAPSLVLPSWREDDFCQEEDIAPEYELRGNPTPSTS